MEKTIVSDYISIIEVFTNKIKVWTNMFIDKTPNIVIAILVFMIGFYFSRFIKKIVIRVLEKRDVKTFFSYNVRKSYFCISSNNFLYVS